MQAFMLQARRRCAGIALAVCGALAGVLAVPLAGWARSPAAPAATSAAPSPVPSAASCVPPPSPEAVQRAAARAAAAAPRDRGMLWRLEKDGRTSWLYGTMHLGRLDWVTPGPRVLAALRASDTLALEIDMTDPREQQVMLQPADPAIAARVLDAARRDRIRREAARACIPEAMLDTLRPLMQAMALTIGAARRQGLHFELSTEFMLLGRAQAGGKRLVGLESAAHQLAMLTPASDAEERELVDQTLEDLDSPAFAAMLDTMAAAWADGDLRALANLKQWCRCLDTPAEQALFKRINDDRNPGIADRLAALHAGGASVFAGVGMLHMTGPQALPQLLRARGFAVRRVLPAGTD